MVQPIFKTLKLSIEIEVRVDVHPQVPRVALPSNNNIIGDPATQVNKEFLLRRALKGGPVHAESSKLLRHELEPKYDTEGTDNVRLLLQAL
jgi:hypothetical protein